MKTAGRIGSQQGNVRERDWDSAQPAGPPSAILDKL
jgi:hypothetical protein